jgi:hypothetical protein
MRIVPKLTQEFFSHALAANLVSDEATVWDVSMESPEF